MFTFVAQQPVVLAALVTGGVAIVTLIVNASLNRALHRQRLAADLELARARGDQDMQLAERKARLDRQEADWRRKAQFAEELLTDFSDFVTRFRQIRESGSFAHEREREGRDQEDPELRQARDPYWPVYRRLQEHQTFVEGLYAKRFRARALFGQDAERPFLLVSNAIEQVRAALVGLMKPKTPLERSFDRLGSQSHRDRWLQAVWNESVEDQPDELDRQALEARDQAERIFGAYLERGPSD